MTSSMGSVRNSITWIAALALLSSFLCFSGYYGLLIFLLFTTSLVLILSTVLLHFKSSKTNQLLEEEKVEDSAPKVEGVVVSEQLQPKSETTYQKKEKSGVDQIDHDYLGIRSADLLSFENESIDQSSTSEDSDVDGLNSRDAAQSPDFSDGWISDEESLIEIALPSGHPYVSPKIEEDTNFSFPLQHKLSSFSQEALFRQHGLVELLAEFYEEENLIEIDITMGSIKCSRFEITASVAS